MAAPSAPEQLKSYLGRHPEQVFIGKALLTIGAVLWVRDAIRGWLPLITLLFPVAFLLYVRMKAAAEGVHPNEMLGRYVTFTPVMYAEGENRFAGATWVTWSLIAANVAVFYVFQAHVNPLVVYRNLIFLPYAPNPWNVPLSALTSMFLHGSPAHLWGNMLFLWAVGTVVERRIGWRAFLLAYLGTGLVAGLVAVCVPWLWTGQVQHGLGASGAIAGVMGVFAVRCYFKTMVFPLPILGILSLVVPMSVRLRVNALVLMGLFFLADLGGGITQLSGRGFSPIGHWAHLGGMASGLLFAALLSLGRQAAQERHLDIADAALDVGVGMRAGRESLQRVLEKDPENPEALLSLARMESRHHGSDEGCQAYARCIEVLAASDPERAARVFEEYYGTYQEGIEPRLQYRLSAYLFSKGNLPLAARSLEALERGRHTPPEIAEKALFQLGRVYELMGLSDAARDVYLRYADTYPAAEAAAKARAKAGALEEAAGSPITPPRAAG